VWQQACCMTGWCASNVAACCVLCANEATEWLVWFCMAFAPCQLYPRRLVGPALVTTHYDHIAISAAEHGMHVHMPMQSTCW
jgi:hypothetical protein